MIKVLKGKVKAKAYLKYLYLLEHNLFKNYLNCLFSKIFGFRCFQIFQLFSLVNSEPGTLPNFMIDICRIH